MSPWSARITTNRHIWQFVGHVLRMRSTFKSDGQKWQTSRQADKLTKACLGIGQIQIGLGRRDRGRALDLNSAWWSVDNLTDLFIYESQMHLSPSCLAPLLQPHNGLCGRHEIEIAKKSQFYRHARVTWPFEWMWTDRHTDTGRWSWNSRQAFCSLFAEQTYELFHASPDCIPPSHPRHKSFDLARRSPFCISTSQLSLNVLWINNFELVALRGNRFTFILIRNDSLLSGATNVMKPWTNWLTGMGWKCNLNRIFDS